MTGKQRVLEAMAFREADRVPRFWSGFWTEFEEAWGSAYGPADLDRHFGSDMFLVAAVESAWPSRAGVVEREGNHALVRTGWGEVKRIQVTAEEVPTEGMGQLVESAIPERLDPDTIRFEDPLADSRFVAAGKTAAEIKDEFFVWCKSGGPYLRAAFMRGEEQFWVDAIEDPDWTRAFVERVADHITTVAVEAMRRFGLEETGMAIYDDVAASWGPFVGPERYEEIFLPALRRMVRAYKDAGARRVMHHSDGNVLSLLDMWVDAGIDAINPVEFRTGMDPVKIREQYGRNLVCTGGLDNSEILPRGDRDEIRDHVRHILQAGRGGGFVIGPHSIGPDIRPDTMAYVLELLNEHGGYPLCA